MKTESNITTLRRPLRVLLVEDSEADALLLLRALQRTGFDPEHERVDSPRDMEQALRENEWDLILADHAMPQFSAPEALEILKQHGLDLPFIIVSGHIEEETAVRAMMAGAHDYIMKDRLARLAPAVERELREAEVRRARAQTEMALRAAQKQLEQYVQERTTDLREANLKLKRLIHKSHTGDESSHEDPGRELAEIAMQAKDLARQLVAEKHSSASDAVHLAERIQRAAQHAAKNAASPVPAGGPSED
jgi:PleD family two-component response regulator